MDILHPLICYNTCVSAATRYTGSSSKVAPSLLAAVGAAGVGATIGGIGGAVSYVVIHPGQKPGDYIRSGAFWRAVGVGAASGAVSGLVGFGLGALRPTKAKPFLR